MRLGKCLPTDKRLVKYLFIMTAIGVPLLCTGHTTGSTCSKSSAVEVGVCNANLNLSSRILVLFSCERLMAFRYSHCHRLVRGRLAWAVLLLVGVLFLSSLTCLEHLVWYYYWLANRPLLPAKSATVTQEEPLPAYVMPEWLAHWDTIQKRADVSQDDQMLISLQCRKVLVYCINRVLDEMINAKMKCRNGVHILVQAL